MASLWIAVQVAAVVASPAVGAWIVWKAAEGFQAALDQRDRLRNLAAAAVRTDPGACEGVHTHPLPPEEGGDWPAGASRPRRRQSDQAGKDVSH